MYTTSVNLRLAWLIDPADLSTAVTVGTSGSAGSATAPIRSAAREGEVRGYAGGRYRAVLGPGTTRGIGLTLRGCTPAQVLQLEAWRGTVLLYRDTYGVRQFGTYLATQVTQWQSLPQADVTIDWRELTYVEAQ